MSEGITDPVAEIKAIQAVAAALTDLDPEATARVLRWAGERFGVKGIGNTKASSAGLGVTEAPMFRAEEAPRASARKFTELSELYAATSPSTDSDKALVAGYFFQFVENSGDFAAQTINSALKQLGHGVSNITSAFNALKAQKPGLVMQVKKAGTTKQARKQYKLTAAGKNAVEQMMAST